MLAAEKLLPQRRERGWTAEIKKLVHQVRYYRLLLRQTMGLPTHANVLSKVGEIAGTMWHSDDAVLIKKKLLTTWTKLDQQVTLEK